jgi:hypothetical protein
LHYLGEHQSQGTLDIDCDDRTPCKKGLLPRSRVDISSPIRSYNRLPPVKWIDLYASGRLILVMCSLPAGGRVDLWVWRAPWRELLTKIRWQTYSHANSASYSLRASSHATLLARRECSINHSVYATGIWGGMHSFHSATVAPSASIRPLPSIITYETARQCFHTSKA